METPTKKKIISFDFDDTIGMVHWIDDGMDIECDSDGYAIQHPNEKIVAKIHKYINDGYEIVIVTSRYEKYKDDIITKLKRWNIPIDQIYCTNGIHKTKTLKRLGVETHYDDDTHEIRHLRYAGIHGVLVRP